MLSNFSGFVEFHIVESGSFLRELTWFYTVSTYKNIETLNQQTPGHVQKQPFLLL